MTKKYNISKKGKKALRKFYKGVTTDMKQNKKIKVLEKKVKELRDPIETKYKYQLINNQAITSIPLSLTQNLIRPWDTTLPASNSERLHYREGDAVTMKNFYLRGKLKIPFANQSLDRDMTTRVRMIYVYYADAPPGNNIHDILEQVDPGVSGVDYVDNFYKRNGRLIYKKLKDVTYNLQPDYYAYSDPATPAQQFSGITTTMPSFRTIRHSLDLSKLPNNGKAKWDDQTSLPKLGQICLYMMSDNPNFDVELTACTQLTWEDQ